MTGGTWPPTVLAGRYVLGRSLGQGGMGSVWEAHDRALDRTVAVKLIQLAAADDEKSRARFEREARAAAGLSHPNIVTVHDFGVDDGVAFMVMERLAGPDLLSLVRTQGPLPVGQALSYVKQAADGLAAAHARGILHRDMKPANLMLTSTGSVKVVDFGIASVEASEHLTNTGQMIGTLAYMAPERSMGVPASVQSDLYSLGCILVALLTGRPPFGGTSGEVLLKHINEPPPTLLGVRADVSPELDAFISSLLAKEPSVRPGSAAEVAVRADELGRPTQTTMTEKSTVAAPVSQAPASVPLADTGVTALDGVPSYAATVIDDPSVASGSPLYTRIAPFESDQLGALSADQHAAESSEVTDPSETAHSLGAQLIGEPVVAPDPLASTGIANLPEAAEAPLIQEPPDATPAPTPVARPAAPEPSLVPDVSSAATRVMSAGGAIDAPGAGSVPAPAAGAAAAGPKKSRMPLLVGGGLVAVVAVGVIATQVLRPGTTTAPSTPVGSSAASAVTPAAAPTAAPAGAPTAWKAATPFPTDVGVSSIALDADGRRAFIVNGQTNMFAVVDRQTGGVLGKTAVGKYPMSVAVDNARGLAVVANDDAASVSVVDLATVHVARTVPIGEYPGDVKIDSAAGRAYISCGGNSNDIAVLDLASFKVSSRIKIGSEPGGIALAGSRAFVAGPGDAVSVLDLVANKVTAKVPVPGSPVAVAVDAAGTRLFVSALDGSVSALDVATGKVSATVTAGSDLRGMALDEAAARLFVTDAEGSTLVEIDTKTLQKVASHQVGDFPTSVALDPATHRLFVSNYQGNVISVLAPA